MSEQPHDRTSGPVHEWFELTYSSYQVLPRVLMQSMPIEWQQRMVACLEEMQQAFEHIEHPEGYKVEPVRWEYPGDLSLAERKWLGIGCNRDDEEDAVEVVETEYYDRDGNHLDRHAASVAVPVRDPLPPYRRGYVEPQGRWASAASGVTS